MIHTVKGFVVVNKSEVDAFLEFSCFFYDPTNVGNLISGSSAFSKSSMHIWKFTVHTRRSLKKIPQTEETQAIVTQVSFQQMFCEGTEEPRKFSHSVFTGEPLNAPQVAKHRTCWFHATSRLHIWNRSSVVSHPAPPGETASNKPAPILWKGPQLWSF